MFLEEDAGPPGVLASQRVDLSQYADRAQGDVLEIPDGGSHYVKLR